MTINHINLPVTNVAEAISFFETHFGFTCIETKGDFIIAVLKNPSNFTLVLMTAKMNQTGNTTYPDAFHIGFLQDDEEQVNEIYTNLKSGGIDIEREPKKIRDAFGFYFHYDNILIEVATGQSEPNKQATTAV
jgi:catechol 2,3-dioxygenase-like lactoylglutathione lyase family enzyme